VGRVVPGVTSRNRCILRKRGDPWARTATFQWTYRKEMQKSSHGPGKAKSKRVNVPPPSRSMLRRQTFSINLATRLRKTTSESAASQAAWRVEG
jgi:hypothetical protein